MTKGSRKLAKVNAQDLSTNGSTNSFASISRDSIYAKSSSSAIRATFPISQLDTNAHGHDTENDIAEVLDCRIAEKIQNELENKMSIEECAKVMTGEGVAVASTAATEIATPITSSASPNGMYENLPPPVATKAKKKVIFKEKRKSKMKNRVHVANNDDGGDGGAGDDRTSCGVGGSIDDKERLEELLAIERISQQIIKGDFGLRGYKIDPEPDEIKSAVEDIRNGSNKNIADVADEIERNELNIDDDVDSQQSVDDRKTTEEKCPYCKLRHTDDYCPIATTDMHIGDAINYSEWCTDYDRRMKRNLEEHDEQDEDMSSEEPDEDLIPYSEASLPSIFEIKAKNSKRLGVFAKQTIPKYQRLGPLQGLSVDESNISDDSTLENVVEINDGYKSTYFNLEDDMKSNWLKYVRPAPSINDRNTVLVHDNDIVYYITCKDIPNGAELLYWSDKCNSRWKKNLGGKTSEFISYYFIV